ncbi:MAG: cation transporter [Pseudobdellovibrionaceae bacterium]
MALGGMQGIENLKFDLQKRELIVLHKESDPKAILSKLVPLNFGAEYIQTDDCWLEVDADDFLFDTEKSKSESHVLIILFAINGSMFFVELIAGFFAQSAGLIADSLDMFADAIVYGVSLYAVGRAKQLQARAAALSGVFQLILALGALGEVFRRFIFGSEPNSPMMMGISVLALIANVSCLLLLVRHREGAVHMKASWIFSTNDVIANIGVIIAGGLVYFFDSRIPDLIVGLIIAFIVFRGSIVIIKLARSSQGSLKVE